MKKKLLSILLCVVMLVSLIPTAVLADTTWYGLRINGVQVTSDNADDILDDGTVSYDAGKKELTLNGAAIDTAYGEGIYGHGALYSGIFSEIDGLTIVLKGTTTIDVESPTGEHCYGMILDGDTTITGSGTLNITVKSDHYNTIGIWCYGTNLTITGAAVNVTAKATGSVGGTGGFYGAVKGIELYSPTSVRKTLTLDGCTVTATADQTGCSSGMYNTCGISLSMASAKLCSGASLTANASGASNNPNPIYGVWGTEAKDKFTVYGGTVTATGKGGSSDDVGAFSSTPAFDSGFVGSCWYGASQSAADVAGPKEISTFTTDNHFKSNYVRVQSSLVPYDVWVNGVQVNSGNADDVLDDGKVSYDAAKKELTLDGATLTKGYIDSGFECGIYAEGELTVVVKGTNSISLDSDNDSIIGIFCGDDAGALTLTGEGTLSITLDDTCPYSDYAVASDGGLVLEDLTLYSSANAYGLYSHSEDIRIDGATVITATDDYDAFYSAPAFVEDADDYTILVADNKAGTDAEEWDGTSALTGFPYVSVTPKSIAPPPLAYPVWVNGVQFNNSNASSGITCGTGGKATLAAPADDDDPYVLTLTDATIDKVYEEYGAIYADCSLRIVSGGDANSITLDDSTEYPGICVTNGDLEITGEADLDITCECDFADGISAGNHAVSISLDGDLTIDAGYSGIYAYDVTLSGDGDAEITGVGYSGIYAYAMTASGDGDVTVTGGEYGISMYGDVTLSGSGKVTVTSTDGIAVYTYASGKKLLLKGTGSPITLTAADGKKAVWNETDKISPVDTNNKYYAASGAPEDEEVVYIYGTAYPVWVNGVRFDSNNASTGIACGSGTATLAVPADDGDPYVLTLTDAVINTAGDKSGAIYAECDLDIVLDGDANSITLTDGEYIDGIFVDGELNITGDADLTVNTEDPTSDGIASAGDMTISCSGDVDITAGEDGIYAARGSDVTISGDGDLTIDSYYGITAYDGNITFSGGGVTIDCEVGIFTADEVITFSGSGEVSVSGDDQGIYVIDGDLTVTGSGSANISAGDDGVGIYMDDGNLTLSGDGDLTICSGDKGIYAYAGDVTVSGSGEVTVTSTDSSAVYLCGDGKALLLEGSATPVTLTAGDGKKAVLNTYDSGSPVDGTAFDDYEITKGAPDDDEVVYELKSTVAHTVTVNVSDSAMGAASADPASAVAGTVIGLKAEANSGYRFARWESSDVDASGGSFEMPAGDVTVTAVFEKKPVVTEPDYFTLTFNTNGGSEIERVGGQKGQVIALNKYIPEKVGYEFDGWYSDKALTEPVETVTLNGYKTVYAKWIEKLPFKDVSSDDPFYDDVAYVYDNDLMIGTGSRKFEPYATLNRATVVTTLYRLEGEPAFMNANVFTDVECGSWYEKAVVWANGKGIVLGYGDGRFGPTDPVTREQLAAILYRYAQVKGYDVSIDENTNFLSFTDVFDISEYAKAPMFWALDKGLVDDADGWLYPAEDATRAAVAAFLHRFCISIVK